NTDKAGKVTDLDVMWISNSAPIEKLKEMQGDTQVLTQSSRVYEYMGYDNPVLIETGYKINVPVNRDFFPSGKGKVDCRIANNTASGIPVRILGSAGGKFLEVLEAKERRNIAQNNLGRGDVVMVNLPNGRTPDVPGKRTSMALVWESFKNKDNKLVALQLMWMRPFRETNQIIDGLQDHHVLITKPEDFKRMGSTHPLMVDPSHSILVPVLPHFFPKHVNREGARLYKETHNGMRIGVVGSTHPGLMEGVIAGVHKGCVESASARALESHLAKEARELGKIEREFGLNKLKL
ncbi:MAG: hypothetical protein ACPG05_03335, partial [Bdellovibrionales bacterium]